MLDSMGKLYKKMILNLVQIGRPVKRRAIGDAIRVSCRVEHSARGALDVKNAFNMANWEHIKP